MSALRPGLKLTAVPKQLKAPTNFLFLWEASTLSEISKTFPLNRTVHYKILISRSFQFCSNCQACLLCFREGQELRASKLLNCNTTLHKIMNYQKNANNFGWEFSNFRWSLLFFGNTKINFQYRSEGKVINFYFSIN